MNNINKNIIFTKLQINDKKFKIIKIFEIFTKDKQINYNVKKYETFSVVSETGDSIYSPTIEELIIVVTKGRDQVFISKDRFEEFENKIIDQILRLNN